jgi:hypothetical protein
MKWRAGVLAFIAACGLAACDSATADEPQQGGTPPPRVKSKKVSAEERLEALSRAIVWLPPRVPIASARLDGDPAQPESLECTFAVTELGGTAAKFDCDLPDGERIRVKYGRSPEIPSEVAAARLLHALGFGADQMMLVEKLRCYGCPAEPFLTMRTLGLANANDLYGKVMNKEAFKDFEWVAIERKHRGRPIESEEIEGWAFFELEVIIAHWDNKSENQRLVCLSQKDWPEGGRCARPMALLQDVGSAFGPRKVDLPKWEKTMLWSDRGTCTATMDTLPYHGATFKPVKISEAGRRHLATLLRQLSDEQIAALFRGARFDQSKGLIGFTASPVPEWVRVFKAKVRQITDGPPCPQ